MSQNSLGDKVAVVTGGASGIGLAIVERVAAGGARVMLSDVNAKDGDAIAVRSKVKFVHGDLTQRADCKSLIEKTVQEFGAVHILVNNVSFQRIDPISNFSEDV